MHWAYERNARSITTSSDVKQLREINSALRRMPREMGLGGNLWDGKTLAAWIAQRYEIDLGVRQCQRLFRQLGFRLRKPRPQIARPIRNGSRRIKKLQALMEDPIVDLWATDEVHF
jgi:transposase